MDNLSIMDGDEWGMVKDNSYGSCPLHPESDVFATILGVQNCKHPHSATCRHVHVSINRGSPK